MAKPRIQGVVFDMDGTLTVPCIDFAEMRRVVNIPEGDMLTVIDQMEPEQRDKTNAALHEFELKALKEMRMMPGTIEVGELLDSLSIPRAIVTRNVEASVQHFHTHVFTAKAFSPALPRTFRPYKPAPDALLYICKQWGIEPSTVVMVGDSPKDDIVCGNRAGAHTILIDYEQKVDVSQLPEEHRPTFHVTSMAEVCDVLQHKCNLSPRSTEQMALQS